MAEIYRGRHLWVEKQEVILPNGYLKQGIVVHPGDAVAVLPVDGNNCYLLSQYRYCIKNYIIEAPAGKCEPGEEPMITAQRELAEEAHLTAERLMPLGTIYTTPGFSDEIIHLFRAEGLTPRENCEMDDDEIIEVHRYSVKEVRKMIQDGRITDAKTICLFFQAFQQ